MTWEEVTPSTESLLEKVERVFNHKTSTTRCIIALSGVPGSGKTSLSKIIVEKINKKYGSEICKLVSQDGFHYYRSQLASMPNAEEAFKLRGAPFTFDSKKFVDIVREIKFSVDKTINVPDFSHSLKDPIENAISVGPETQIVILEGNYVNLDEDYWKEIGKYADQKWMLSADEETIKERLVRRHVEAGICATADEAATRVEQNDLPNARYIMSHSVLPDVVIRS